MSSNEHKVWTFGKCPACGSKQRIAEAIGREERKRQKIGDGFTPVVEEKTALIVDPRRVIIGPTRVPALLLHYDVCLECGCHYCVRIERGEGVVEPGPPPGRPPVLGGRG